MIQLTGACFGYGKTPVISGLNFSLCAGEALAVIGPNGAGKTTLLSGLLGQAELLSGQVQLDETCIGYVPQTTHFDPSFPISASNVVEMGCYANAGRRPWRLPAPQRRAVQEALEKVGLAPQSSSQFGQLSGGQRQRVLIARALVAQPGLLLLDEPFNGLDPESRQVLVELIGALKADGVAIIATTHDLSLAHRVCDRTLIVAGSQKAFGETAEVLDAMEVEDVLCSSSASS